MPLRQDECFVTFDGPVFSGLGFAESGLLPSFQARGLFVVQTWLNTKHCPHRFECPRVCGATIIHVIVKVML